jgi:hypothetical protein
MKNSRRKKATGKPVPVQGRQIQRERGSQGRAPPVGAPVSETLSKAERIDRENDLA